MLVIPGARTKRVVVAGQLPVDAAVIRAVDARLLGLNHGPYAVGARRRRGDADLAQRTSGQALIVGKLGPVIATIRGLPDSTALASGLQFMWQAARSPEGSVEDARIVEIERQLIGADILTPKE